MAGHTSLGRISDPEFFSLLQELSGTSKGRSFLDEYLRRARPQETDSLLEALGRIEATIATVRDQLQPERIADELRRIGMTLEIATDGATVDAAGDEAARRLALVERAGQEIAALAASLGRPP